MDQVAAEWVLIVDADERIPAPLQTEIQSRIAVWKTGDRWPMKFRRNYFYGAWVRHAGVYPDYQIRLFRRGRARYNDVPVHENLIVLGGSKTHQSDGPFHRARIRDHFKKFGLYTTLAAQDKGRTVRTVHAGDLVVRPLIVFVKSYVLKQGFRDGVRGLIVSVFAGMYTFVKYAKLWT
jgi:hypothetical protein